MNIALTADPFIPVPPVHYGGIERIIALLIEEYIRAGHQVTLFAHKDSQVPCELIAYHSAANSKKANIANSLLIASITLSRRFDIVHSFGRLAYLLPLLPLGVPKLMSYQREPTLSQIRRAVRLARKNTLAFSGCSNYITSQIAAVAPAFTIYNAVDIRKYPLTAHVKADAPLVFLGRIEAIKGTHTAIDIAQKTGRKLIIAGNIPPQEEAYFNELIRPRLSDDIVYIGPVDDGQKAALLGQASALLMPIHWNEPFGIVMIEAMACGTPVIGFGRGAVPEVVRHWASGFVAGTAEELCELVPLIPALKRTAVRQQVEERFSSEQIAADYLTLYQLLIATRHHGKK
jgi:glycosyltransferase involved in cell wall biosynthesis